MPAEFVCIGENKTSAWIRVTGEIPSDNLIQEAEKRGWTYSEGYFHPDYVCDWVVTAYFYPPKILNLKEDIQTSRENLVKIFSEEGLCLSARPIKLTYAQAC
jgi:hypothetical protein